MKEINVYKEYGLTSISPNNDIWAKMIVDHLVDEDDTVVFDFNRIRLIQPWKNEMFKTFIADKRVKIKIYTDEMTKRTIDMMLKMGNYDTEGKVENINIVVQTTDTAKVKNIKRLADNVKNVISYNSEKHLLELVVRKAVTQIGNPETVEGIKMALEQTVEKHPDVRLIQLNFTNVTIQGNMFKLIASISKDCGFDDRYIRVEELDTNEDKIKKLAIHRVLKDTMKKSTSDKIVDIKNDNIKPGAVVMLHMFKETKSKNEFNQMNDGEYTISRVAIFNGFEKRNNEIILRFTAYFKDTFCTRRHYYLENDYEELTKMRTKEYRFEINEIGYADKFTGTKAHFHLPIQFDENDSLTTYKEGVLNVQTIKVTLPEYIKMVLDDNRVRYDTELLLKCIGKTNKYLKYMKKKAMKEAVELAEKTDKA